MPDPLFAGNGTALWLRAGATGCDSWYPKVEEFLLLRVMQNRFLSTAVPGCGWAPGRPRSKRPKQKVARRRTGGTVVLGCLTLQL